MKTKKKDRIKRSLYNLHHITVIYGMQTNEVNENNNSKRSVGSRHRGRLRIGIKKSATTVRNSAWTDFDKQNRPKKNRTRNGLRSCTGIYVNGKKAGERDREEREQEQKQEMNNKKTDEEKK